MATQVQNRRGTTAEHSTFTGANGELTVDTTKKTVVVHDGTTAGGAPLLRENGSQNAVTTGTSTAASFIPSSSTVPTNGVYLPAANSVAISTNSTGRLFIDSSGRLLVGTSSALVGAVTPSAKLQIIGNASGATDRGAQICLGHSAGAASIDQYDLLGAIHFTDNSAGEFARIEAYGDGVGGTNDYPGRLVFSTCPDGSASPVERLRIQNNGDVLIGTTTSEGRITIRGDSCGGYIGAIENVNGTNCDPAHGLIFRAGKNSGSTSSAFFSFRRPDNTVLGSITQNGTSSVAYNTSSDYRLKENIAAFVDGIARLQQLKPSRFNFIEDPGKIVDGFIAHEVQAVVPEAVTGEKDAVDDDGNPIYQGIDQSKLVPLLTAALQEAVAKIESLEARLTAAGI